MLFCVTKASEHYPIIWQALGRCHIALFRLLGSILSCLRSVPVHLGPKSLVCCWGFNITSSGRWGPPPPPKAHRFLDELFGTTLCSWVPWSLLFDLSLLVLVVCFVHVHLAKRCISGITGTSVCTRKTVLFVFFVVLCVVHVQFYNSRSYLASFSYLLTYCLGAFKCPIACVHVRRRAVQQTSHKNAQSSKNRQKRPEDGKQNALGRHSARNFRFPTHTLTAKTRQFIR